MIVALALVAKDGCKKEDSSRKGQLRGKNGREGKVLFDRSYCSRGFSLQKSGFRKEDSFPLCCFGSLSFATNCGRVLTQVGFV